MGCGGWVGGSCCGLLWIVDRVVVVRLVGHVVGGYGCGGSLIRFWCGWVSTELWFVGRFLAGLGL